MAEPIFINELIDKIQEGSIRIPSFQRGFVWDADRVAHLMDSIYKGFPFGTLLFWRTKIGLATEKNLGPYQLPEKDPDYPIDYILDGQQRAISIFGVFQHTLEPNIGEDTSIFEIYFDLTREANVQDTNFIYVPNEEYDPYKHFPLRYLFNAPEYRKLLRDMPEEIAEKVDILYRNFTTARIPIETFETNDRTSVAIVFERINRLGLELDTLQLLSAWTWSEEFDLQEQFADLAEELAPYNFRNVGEDSDLLLRCCAAILAHEAKPQTIINLDGPQVRSRFNEIKNGVLRSVDFLRNSFNIYSTTVLPYPSIIIPLSVYFASDNEQEIHPDSKEQEILEKWAWKTFFSRRYSKRLDQLNQDIIEIAKLRNGQKTSLGDFNVEITKDFFQQTQFNLGTANTKTFILMLSTENPLNFINGSPVQMDSVLKNCNKREFHHVFPKKYLNQIGISKKKTNSLVNYVVLSKADNNKIGGEPPSSYRKLMPDSDDDVRRILQNALCPNDIFHDDPERFFEERANLLVEKATKLMNQL